MKLSMVSTNSRRFCLIVGLMLASVVSADMNTIRANEVVPVIDGEIFDQIMIVKGQDSNSSQVIKYIRSSESFEGWSKQVAYNRVNDKEIATPKAYAEVLVKALQNVNIGAKYQATASENNSVILLDFVVQHRTQGFMELNLYRIEEGSKGIYSLQMISRMPLVSNPTAENMAPIINMRKAWMAQAANFDMTKMKVLLDAQ